MKPVRFHPEAEAEMIQAAQYYELLQSDLGRRFLTSMQESINRVKINPSLYPVIDLDVQRCLTKTFPFGILFRDSFKQIVIVAVMHLHRDPDYWKTR